MEPVQAVPGMHDCRTLVACLEADLRLTAVGTSNVGDIGLQGMTHFTACILVPKSHEVQLPKDLLQQSGTHG